MPQITRRSNTVEPAIERIDRATVRHVVALIEKKLGELDGVMGLTFAPEGGARFDAQRVTVKVTAMIKRAGSNRLEDTPEGRTFVEVASLYGFKPSDLGRTFVAGGKEWKIVGFRERARTRPVLAARVGDVTGKRFVFATFDVKRYLGTGGGQ